MIVGQKHAETRCAATVKAQAARKREAKEKRPADDGALRIPGANERIRTADLRITSALLYQLSHVGESASCEAAV